MFEQLSIRKKLALVLWSAALLAFVVALAGLLLGENLTLKSRARQALRPYAQLVSVGAEAAVNFNDAERAQEILDTLRANPQIVTAEIIGQNNSVLASYLMRTNTRVAPFQVKPDGVYLSQDIAELIQQLPNDAHLRLVMSLGELRRLPKMAVWAFGVGAVVLLAITWSLLFTLQKTIVYPISTLAETTERIRVQSDYTQRVPSTGTDEVAQLRRSFNAMMEAVQQRENELRQLNDELDQRVKARTAQLESANRELESFSYSVSHDLRAPLRSINGFSQVLLEDCGDKLDAEAMDNLNRIRAAAERMGNLIDDILRLSKISRTDAQVTDVNLSRMMDAVASELKDSDPSRSVEFIIQPDCKVRGDASLLRIAVENMLSNAWKYTSKTEHARIEFGATNGPEGTTLFVRDNGCGFDMQYVGRLFNAFQRLHDCTEFPGIGIGLAIVQRVMRKHGGEVWISGRPGEGATIYFSLPERKPTPG